MHLLAISSLGILERGANFKPAGGRCGAGSGAHLLQKVGARESDMVVEPLFEIL